MEKQRSILKLRFLEFDGEWENMKLGEIAKFLDGRRKPIKESDRAKMKGDYPYYGASGIIDYVNEYLFDEELILLGEDGENIISRNLPLAFRVSGKCWINNHAHVIKPNKNTDIDFLTIGLEGVSYAKYNTGTAQPKLNQEVCRGIPLHLPILPEQQKIASFFTTIDLKISQLKQKKNLLEQYKKGVMQKIFSQEIRFRDDNRQEFPKWEKMKLGEVAEVIMGQSPDSNSYNTEGIGRPLIQGNADIKNRLSNPRNWTAITTKECHVGDLIMTVRAPVGAIAKSIHNACIGRGVCAVRNKTQSNIEFLYQFLLDYELRWANIEQGSTFTAVSGADIKKLKISIPSLPEQSKIANFLSAIDDKINHTHKQIEKAEVWKKGLMQQMFI